jgi:hypothetical protein
VCWSVALFLLGAVPGLALHHALNYAVGGTWRPANAVPEYLAWPGSPFSAATMTGQLNHPTVLHFAAYALQMLAGKQGFVLHNLPLLLVVPACLWLLRRGHATLRPEVVWALSWCLLSWLAYALTSNNYSGVCLSIRWFVPLLAPAFLVLALYLRQNPDAFRSLLVLTAWGCVMMALAWPRGPWTFRMVPYYWFVAGAALVSWLVLGLRRRRSVAVSRPAH